jgi:uncharacterized damage-inducible protein DinB
MGMPEVAELADKLKSEGEKYAAIFADLTDEQWQKEVYTEGSIWTVRSILAHLVTAERGFTKLFPSIRDGGPGASEDFDIDRYNASQQEKNRELTPRELLEQYKAVRVEMTAWVSSLDEADLDKTGRHPFLGHTTLREMIKLIYLHNQLHYRDLRKVLK